MMRACRQIAKNRDRCLIHEGASVVRDPRPVHAWSVMTRYLVLCVLLTAIAGAAVRGAESELPQIAPDLVRVGLVNDGPPPSPTGATPDESNSCAQVSFSRNLKYG